MTSAQQHTSEGERRERLIDYLHDKEALLGLDRPGQGSQDRTTTKILLALYEATLLHKATADFDDEKYWFSAEQICSKITGWERAETPFKNTVKRHLERLGKSGYVLCRKHPVTNHDQYAMTNTGADYCDDNIPAWKKGLYPTFLVLAKLGKDITNVTRSSTRKETQLFMAIEEQNLAFEFLKNIFSPDPDHRVQFYHTEILQSSSILYARPPWSGQRPYGSENGGQAYFVSMEKWGGRQEFDVRYALDQLRANVTPELVKSFGHRLSGQLCLQCKQRLEFLQEKECFSICGHMVRLIAQELVMQGFPMDQHEWSFMLIDPEPFRDNEIENLQKIEKLLENEEDRETGRRLLKSMNIVGNVVYGSQYDTLTDAILQCNEFVHVCLNDESAVKQFVRKLENMDLVHFVRELDHEVSFYIGAWLLPRIARELWESGAFDKLMLASYWRKIASSYLPVNDQNLRS